MSELLWWHRVGQKVVCVDARRQSDLGNAYIDRSAENDVYTVTAIIPTAGPTGIGFWLREVRQGAGGAFSSRRFRPVHKTSIDCFRSLLNPTPETTRKFAKEDA